jgi:hypothetical protein
MLLLCINMHVHTCTFACIDHFNIHVHACIYMHIHQIRLKDLSEVKNLAYLTTSVTKKKSFVIYREMNRFYSMLVYLLLLCAYSGLDKRASLAWNSYNTNNVLEMKRVYSMLVSF